MAKIYSAPKEVGNKPAFNSAEPFSTHSKNEREYTAKVQVWAKQTGSSEFAGEIIRFPVADGYAQYVVLSLKPVKLIHLDTGDGWQFPYAHRITAADVRREAEYGRAINEIFSKGRP